MAVITKPIRILERAAPTRLQASEMRWLADQLERGRTIVSPAATSLHYNPTEQEWQGIIEALRIAAEVA